MENQREKSDGIAYTYDQDGEIIGMLDEKALEMDYTDQIHQDEEPEDLVECCFCGKEVEEIMSNNPWPICTIENARCCCECNLRVVIPGRIAQIPDPDNFTMPQFELVSGATENGKSPLINSFFKK